MPEAKQILKIGERTADGTVFAGLSPGTGKPMFAAPQDAPLTYEFNDAARYVEQLNAQRFLGHDDWRMPTKGELNVLFNNRAAIGGFNTSGEKTPEGWYLSSTGGDDPDFNAWGQSFDYGGQGIGYKIDDSALRLVR
jgi:hypothetical protein